MLDQLSSRNELYFTSFYRYTIFKTLRVNDNFLSVRFAHLRVLLDNACPCGSTSSLIFIFQLALVNIDGRSGKDMLPLLFTELLEFIRRILLELILDDMFFSHSMPDVCSLCFGCGIFKYLSDRIV